MVKTTNQYHSFGLCRMHSQLFFAGMTKKKMDVPIAGIYWKQDVEAKQNTNHAFEPLNQP